MKTFLDGLTDEEVATIVAGMKEFAAEGLAAARHLQGEIFEVRADASTRSFRLLFSTEGRWSRILLSLSVFEKRTQERHNTKSIWPKDIWPTGGDAGRRCGRQRSRRPDTGSQLRQHSVDAMASKMHTQQHGQGLRRRDHRGAHPEEPALSAARRRGGSASEACASPRRDSREAGPLPDSRRGTDGDLGIGREQARGGRRRQDVHVPALLCGDR